MQAGFKWKRFARPELDTLPKTFRLTQEHRNIIEAIDRYKLLSSAHILKLFCRTPTDVKRSELAPLMAKTRIDDVYSYTIRLLRTALTPPRPLTKREGPKSLGGRCGVLPGSHFGSSPWSLSLEHGKVSLLMANAALKARAFERAFFNAKTALLVFSRANDPSVEFKRGLFAGSFDDEMYEADEIASEALHHTEESDIEGVENEWDKIERDYEKAGGAANARTNLAVSWGLAGRFQKWRMRRPIKAAMKESNLFGEWRTPN